LIITGLAGSGKTVVSHFLEDLGYYCIDNLPAKLIPRFVDLWRREEVKIEKVALVVDIREASFTSEFPSILRSIRKKVSACVIFLTASDEEIIRRYSESRRRHPLVKGKSISSAVALERKRLAEIKNLSDEVIDTTSMSLSEFKKILSSRFVKKKGQRMQTVVISFGYKHGVPVDSDLVFDTRFLPNPFYIDELRSKTGKHKKIKEFVCQSSETQKFLKHLYKYLDYLMPKFIEEGKSNLTISIGCTGGKHRSVVLGEELKKYLKEKQYRVRIHHRDIYK
jgi:UPF0042 nucleotide-binding protein